MDRTGEIRAVIHLDTQVAIWRFIRKPNLLSKTARRLFEREGAVVSPMVVLEYEILSELGRFPDTR